MRRLSLLLLLLAVVARAVDFIGRGNNPLYQYLNDALPPQNPRFQHNSKVERQIHVPKTWTYAMKGADWRGSCHSGMSQSPIDLKSAVAPRGNASLTLHYGKHTNVPLACDELMGGFVVGGSANVGKVLWNGKLYLLRRLQFHSPSEHRINGHAYDAEVQFIHEHVSPSDSVANTHNVFRPMLVLSLLLKKSDTTNTFLKDFGWSLQNVVDRQNGKKTITAKSIDLTLNGEVGGQYFVYSGSMSTPPCAEPVMWAVMKEVAPMTAEQSAVFTSLSARTAELLSASKRKLTTARAIQPSSGRIVSLLSNVKLAETPQQDHATAGQSTCACKKAAPTCSC